MAKLQLMDTTMKRTAESLGNTYVDRRCAAHFAQDGSRWILGHRGLGRCNIRHLPTLFGRKSLQDASATHQVKNAEHSLIHALAWTEPCGLQALFPRDLLSFHRGSTPKWHRCLPRVRRVERYPAMWWITPKPSRSAEPTSKARSLTRYRLFIRSIASLNTVSSSKIWVPIPSPSKTWRACSRRIVPSVS